MKYKLPVVYDELSRYERKEIREQYVIEQGGKCFYCGYDLSGKPPLEIVNKDINWDLFPPGFLNAPIHLQHDHYNGMTEGAVHAYCNAVMWQYEGR